MSASVVELEARRLGLPHCGTDSLTVVQIRFDHRSQSLKGITGTVSGEHASLRVELQLPCQVGCKLPNQALPEVPVGLVPCSADRLVGG